MKCRIFAHDYKKHVLTIQSVLIMSGRTPKNFNIEEELDFVFDDDMENEPEPKKRSTRKSSKPKNIVEAMDRILTAVHKSELTPGSMRKASSSFKYLDERLSLTKMQCIFLSMLCNSGRPLDYCFFSNFLGCHRIRLICSDSELQQLVRRGFINRLKCDHGEDDYVVRGEVMEAFQKNESYKRQSFENLSQDDFFFRFRYLMSKKQHNNMIWTDLCLDMDELFKGNPHIRFVKEVERLNLSKSDFFILLACVHSYIGDNESADENTIVKFQDDKYETNHIISRLRRNRCILLEKGLIIRSCEEGFLSGNRYELTDQAKALLLDGYEMDNSVLADPRRGLVHYDEIKEKVLFYNSSEHQQINRLSDMLKETNFKGIQERLEKKGMRKGFACLFYGAPGTGKTETVLQLARQTGRDIFQVNIASLRDKWVGESEKNIKAIFTRYKQYCKSCDVAPILLFNEADAIINKRTENIEHSVDKMDNAMQNIILQEIENLEGILIATTNLTCNLDNAFERRFLFKVEFKNPSVEAKTNIWTSMIPDLSDKDATTLAKKYDFSGGEIENVSRKLTVDSILYGKETTMKQLTEYCDSELILKKKGKERSKVNGFSLSA